MAMTEVHDMLARHDAEHYYDDQPHPECPFCEPEG